LETVTGEDPNRAIETVGYIKSIGVARVQQCMRTANIINLVDDLAVVRIKYEHSLEVFRRYKEPI
jgi:hypothetical protein